MLSYTKISRVTVILNFFVSEVRSGIGVERWRNHFQESTDLEEDYCKTYPPTWKRISYTQRLWRRPEKEEGEEEERKEQEGRKEEESVGLVSNEDVTAQHALLDGL